MLAATRSALPISRVARDALFVTVSFPFPINQKVSFLMLTNTFYSLATVGALAAGVFAFGAASPAAPAGSTASCCGDDCCEGCPDCDCNCPGCENCADGCNCTCNG